MWIFGRQSGNGAGFSQEYFCFYPVSIIPPALHINISFTYNQHYVISATDSVIKTDTQKKPHIPFLWHINQTMNTETLTLKYPLTMKHYIIDTARAT
jgi:hypothetical protein